MNSILPLFLGRTSPRQGSRPRRVRYISYLALRTAAKIIQSATKTPSLALPFWRLIIKAGGFLG
jgi:hypothetical protein